MDIKDVFYKKMINVEFSSFWDIGGDIEPRIVRAEFAKPNSTESIEHEKKLTKELRVNLLKFYTISI
jgi:hypothetical protein